MMPISKIVERNADLFSQEKWLFINPPEPDMLAVSSVKHSTILHQTLDIFLRCCHISDAFNFDSRDIVNNNQALKIEQKMGEHTHIFAPFLDPQANTDKFSNVLICMPKSKRQFSMLAHMAAASVGEGGSVYVVGENRSGIKSVSKSLTHLGQVQKVDSARHCTLLCITVNSAPKPFVANDYLTYDTYNIGNTALECAAFPGVFSDGRLDAGTDLLLTSLPMPIHGRTLDFACGAGVIACFLKTASSALTIDLLDVSALALYSAAFTLHANNQHATLCAADGLTGIRQSYSNIVTNPPFHTGVNTDYTIVTQFIKRSVDCLKKGGKLFVVANRFLPYPEQLAEHFSSVDTLAQNTRFSVYKSA